MKVIYLSQIPNQSDAGQMGGDSSQFRIAVLNYEVPTKIPKPSNEELTEIVKKSGYFINSVNLIENIVYGGVTGWNLEIVVTTGASISDATIKETIARLLTERTRLFGLMAAGFMRVKLVNYQSSTGSYQSAQSTQTVRASGNYSSSSAAQTYIVQRGDTLSKIAANFGTTVSQLASLNNIPASRINQISIGQALKIGSGATVNANGTVRASGNTTNWGGTSAPPAAQTEIDKYLSSIFGTTSDAVSGITDAVGNALPNTGTFWGGLGLSTPIALVGGGLLLILLLRR